MKLKALAAAGALLLITTPIAVAQPDTTVVNPPPVPIPTEVTPPPLTITLPPPPPPVTSTETVTAPAPPPVTSTVTVTAPPPTTTTPPPQVCEGPINITTGGTYTGCYKSDVAGTPAVRISTTQPVTLSRARIIAKGAGVWAYDTKGAQLTIRDSVFEQQDPGAVVEHRAVRVNEPKSFVFEYNKLTDTDGVLVHGLRTVPIDRVIVRFNQSTNIGRYPRPTAGGCCVQFLGLDNVVTPDGQVHWNWSRNTAGQSGVEDNIGFYISGGTDAAHRIDVGWNLIDGAYSRNLSITDFTGGGINLGDGGGGSGVGGAGNNFAHENIVISTTNYGISVNGPNNYANNNLLVNDGAEQQSEFGQAIVAWPEVSPPGVHATASRHNWKRSTTDPNQYPCYVATYCQGAAVSTTEQQARDFWESQRVLANVTIGPRP